jgi:hypothetical protein
MALPTSGLISLANVNTELKTTPTSLIRLNNSNVRYLATKPTGLISLSDLYGKSMDTLLLMHFDGTNGQQVYTDTTGNYTVSGVTSSSYLSSTRSKFGGTSGMFNASVIHMSTNKSGLTAYSGNFTIEFFVYHVSGDYISRYTTYGPVDASVRRANTRYEIFNIIGPPNVYYGTGEISSALNNQWVHLAKVRNGNTITLYRNGTAVGSYTFTGSVSFSFFSIGCASPEQFTGYIDEYRVSLVARYTSNFTPPTAPF